MKVKEQGCLLFCGLAGVCGGRCACGYNADFPAWKFGGYRLIWLIWLIWLICLIRRAETPEDDFATLMD